MPSDRREIALGQAINEAICEEMTRDESVILMGEDVVEGGVFKVTKGILEKFGPERVWNTPISEAGFTGLGVGAAMTGMRPIIEIMFGDFLTLAMDQIVNQAAKIHYMSGGHWRVPLVIRTTLGAGRAAAAQHSQSLQAWLAHIPGVKVAIPATPYDAKGLLKSAVRDNNPVVFFEDKIMYRTKGHVPENDDYTIPLGRADVKRKGKDVTLIGTSSMVYVAMDAAEKLASEGIEAEVIDLRTLTPLDEDALVASVRKTSRCVIVDEGYRRFGAGAEIAAILAEKAFNALKAPLRRLGAMDVPVPFSPVLEQQTIPSVEEVCGAARALIDHPIHT